MLVLAVLALFEWPLTELVLQTSKHEWPRETQAVVVVNLSLLLLSRPLSRSLAGLTDWNSEPELECSVFVTLVLSEIFHFCQPRSLF